MEQIQQQEKKQTNEYEKRENKKRDSLYIRDFKKEQKQRATEMFSNDFSMTLSGVKKQISFPSSNSQSSGIFVGDIPDNFLNKVVFYKTLL
jgi:hypothetical protein